MNVICLLLAAADPSATLDVFHEAWAKGDLAAATAQVTENATFTLAMDPAETLSKRVPDATFEGKEAVSALLWSFLPIAKLQASEGSLTLEYGWAKKLGLEAAHFAVRAKFAPDGRIRALELTLAPEDAARALPALPEQNKNVVRRYTEEVNKKNFAVVNEVLSPSFVQHSVVATSPGREGITQLYGDLKAAFPDFVFTLDELIAEGDRVATRMTCRYTHKGEYLGVPPTGKAVQLLKMDVFRFVNGKCFEHWDSADRLGLLQQLGVIPKLPKWNNLPGYEGFR